MRMLNTNSFKKSDPAKITHWYRVAILKYDNSTLGYYTCVIDKPHHQLEIQTRGNFVRWEDAQEVIV